MRNRAVKRVTWIGAAVNLFLALLKGGIGWLGGSQAMIADAVHSLSDLTTDFAILIGVRYWSTPPDEEHPYGHGRIETLVTVAIGATLGVVGIGIAYKAIVGIHQNHPTQPGAAVLAGALLSIAGKEALYRWTVMRGRQLQSRAVIANAWHHRSDAVSSIPVAIAVIAGMIYPAWAFADHVAAVVVAIFILYAAWGIARDALFELADEGVSPDVRNEIRQIVLDTPHVRSVHAIRGRRMGGGIQVDLHLLVDADLTVREGHEISEIVQDRLLTAGPSVLHALVHLEPYDETSPVVNHPDPQPE